MSASTVAALVGAWGLQAQLGGATGMYVADTSPAAEATYHARFYFSPNGATLPDGSVQDILTGRSAGGTTIFRVQLRRSSGAYQIRGQARADGGANLSTGWYTISNASHVIEIAWQAATTRGGSDGALSLWLDGAPKQTRGGVANGGARLEEVRLGPSSGLTGGMSGAEFFDAFASTRGSYIGP